ncbi:precorrin-2 dehydrogenase/sirohydrochlorin ferrochelatase family protein [Gemmata sp.]|uniref:precorrin-2 dehydrogenase/sirohydrochlorin ferrochelatase family protein n=1 Tax=Gemmata sp. TaxID=1914242 RepID=UPI003F6EACC1
MFPVTLNLAGRLAVVVGGGAVGSRKAAAARAAGAAVRIVDPVGAASGTAQLISEPYRPDHLTGAFLVFACATPTVNARVVADAHSRGILVNSASDPSAGDFTLPSVVRSGDLTLAIGTGGAAPSLARRIREKLEGEFDAAFADWLCVLAEVRIVVFAEVPDADRRRELLDAFADWPWLARLRAEGAEAVKAAMLAEVSGGTMP